MNESPTNQITTCASLAASGVKLHDLDLFGPIRKSFIWGNDQGVEVTENSATRQRHCVVVDSEKAHWLDQQMRRTTTMQPTVAPEQRQAAKRQMIEQIEQGASVQQARSQSELHMHRAAVYRLLKRVRAEGEMAYTDGRHGHPIKLRGEVRTFLIEGCQATPSISSPMLQQVIQERFGLSISVSQLNRVRASLGLSRRIPPEKKLISTPTE